MNKLGNKLIKRSMAALLLMLLVFIHTEKAIHHHERTIVKKQGNVFSIASKSLICSICDYVFAKDAGLSEQPDFRSSLKYFRISFSPVSSFYFNPVAITIADRGPPSC